MVPKLARGLPEAGWGSVAEGRRGAGRAGGRSVLRPERVGGGCASGRPSSWSSGRNGRGRPDERSVCVGETGGPPTGTGGRMMLPARFAPRFLLQQKIMRSVVGFDGLGSLGWLIDLACMWVYCVSAGERGDVKLSVQTRTPSTCQDDLKPSKPTTDRGFSCAPSSCATGAALARALVQGKPAPRCPRVRRTACLRVAPRCARWDLATRAPA